MESFINLLTYFGKELLPVFVVNDFENAIKLSGGKYTNRIYYAGWYWKVPFYDEILTVTTILTTLSIPTQSLVTIDNKSITVKGVVKYKIDNVEHFILEIYDATDAISDTTQSIIARECTKRTWQEIREEDIDNEITKKLRLAVKKWGVHIENVTLSDKTESTVLRIFNDTDND
jgi:regulator of protease activity HflC (stomatin/prohibitin superfamily)